jgi:hypothetical protein
VNGEGLDPGLGTSPYRIKNFNLRFGKFDGFVVSPGLDLLDLPAIAATVEAYLDTSDAGRRKRHEQGSFVYREQFIGSAFIYAILFGNFRPLWRWIGQFVFRRRDSLIVAHSDLHKWKPGMVPGSRRIVLEMT